MCVIFRRGRMGTPQAGKPGKQSEQGHSNADGKGVSQPQGHWLGWNGGI